eukprot:15024038-Alexandrium_andersonii.AAC.1
MSFGRPKAATQCDFQALFLARRQPGIFTQWNSQQAVWHPHAVEHVPTSTFRCKRRSVVNVVPL